MGRGGSWPPHSWSEWMVGQNFRPKRPRPPAGQKPVLKVELSENDDSGDDVIEITYPGRRRRASMPQKKVAPASNGKKVRFKGDRRPSKSALKKSSGSDTSDTLVDTSDDSAELDTSDNDTSDIDISDIESSSDDAPVAQKKGKSAKSQVVSCKKGGLSDPSAADDALPHPSCRCKRCVQGRKILKAVIQFEAKTKAAEDAKVAQIQSKSRDKQKGKKAVVASDTDGDTTDEDVSEQEKKADAKGKKSKKQKPKTGSKADQAGPKANKPSPVQEPPQKPVNKTMFKLPEVHEKMKPRLLMTPVAKVVQVEHAFEGPYDPRPNAFYDNGKGITRVYHGPKYGNHHGTLYGDYPQKPTTPPTTASAPPDYVGNPCYAMPQLPLPPYSQHGPLGSMLPRPVGRTPAHLATIPESNVKPGISLTGFPPPTIPHYYNQMQSQTAPQETWPNTGSDKGIKKGTPVWGSFGKPPSNKVSKEEHTSWSAQNKDWDGGSKKKGNGWDAPASNYWEKISNKNQDKWGSTGAAGADWGAVNAAPDNNVRWRSGGAGASLGAGDSPASDKAKIASPFDFNWDPAPAEASFKRTSKGSKGSKGSKNSSSPQNKNDWGATENQKSGGWGNTDGKDQTWGATGDIDGNGGGTTGWDKRSNKSGATGKGDAWAGSNNNVNTGWASLSNKSAPIGGRGAWETTGNAHWSAGGKPPSPDSNGSKPRFPLTSSKNQNNETWGVPPGSFPGSIHPSGGDHNNGSNHNGKLYHSRPSNRFQDALPSSQGFVPSVDFHHGRQGSCHCRKEDYNRMNPRFQGFSGSQPGDARSWSALHDEFYRCRSRRQGPRDWDNKASDQATGPSTAPDWQNQNVAQDTHGKSSGW